MVEGIVRRRNVGNTCSCVMRSEQISVTAKMSIVLEIIRSVREAVFSRIERMLVVARQIYHKIDITK